MRPRGKFFIPASLTLLLLPIFCSNNSPGVKSAAKISRVVSLSPSITREMIDLGVGAAIIGVTSFDRFRADGVEIVGTLVQPNIEKIIELKPDVILSSEEDGLVQNIDRLNASNITATRFDKNRNYIDICENYVRLGRLFGKELLASAKIRAYHDRLRQLKKDSLLAVKMNFKSGIVGAPGLPRVAMFVSHRPLMAVSDDSYIGGIIRDSGGICSYGRVGRPYPLVSFESLIELDPDIVISIIDERDGLHERLALFPQLKCVRNKSMCTISPDIISYYTPADYLESVTIVSGILMKYSNL
jgi:iron complex transport system substrate-binding protein